MFIELVLSVELVWAMALFEFNNGANPIVAANNPARNTKFNEFLVFIVS